MNSVVKSIWLSSLRSGRYKQCHERLKYGDSFCGVGVLCDLYCRNFNITWENDSLFGIISNLPAEVKEWAEIGDMDSIATLYGYNDNAKLDFEQLADLIESIID